MEMDNAKKSGVLPGEQPKCGIAAHQMQGKYVVVTFKPRGSGKAKESAIQKQGVLLAVDPVSGNLILLQVCLSMFFVSTTIVT